MSTRLNPVVALGAILVLAGALGACRPRHAPPSETLSEGGQYGDLRGWGKIDAQISKKLLDEGHIESLNFQVHRLFGPAATRIEGLFGGFPEHGAQRPFQNGDPNGVSILLWYQTLTRLSDKVATLCDVEAGDRTFTVDVPLPTAEETGPLGQPEPGETEPVEPVPAQVQYETKTLKLKASFHTALQGACTWTDAGKRTAAEQMWNGIVPGAAPAAARESWLEFATSEEVKALDTVQRVRALLLTLLLEPNFILEGSG